VLGVTSPGDLGYVHCEAAIRSASTSLCSDVTTDLRSPATGKVGLGEGTRGSVHADSSQAAHIDQLCCQGVGALVVIRAHQLKEYRHQPPRDVRILGGFEIRFRPHDPSRGSSKFSEPGGHLRPVDFGGMAEAPLDADERLELCDLFDEFGPSVPTLLEGPTWTSAGAGHWSWAPTCWIRGRRSDVPPDQDFTRFRMAVISYARID
jgi:hypothetical protein